MDNALALVADFFCRCECWTGVWLASPTGLKTRANDRCAGPSRHSQNGRSVSRDSFRSQASTADVASRAAGSRSSRSVGLSSFSDASDDSDSDCDFPGQCAKTSAILKQSVAAIMYDASKVPPWDTSRYQFHRVLQKAHRNQGVVELMHSIDAGNFVAVKKMPNTWMRFSPDDFRSAHGTESEQPWLDLGITRYLRSQSWPYLCRPLGIFRDSLDTYVVSSYATEGDLFTWCQSLPTVGLERTSAVKPIARQIFAAMKSLHDLGIAHCDLSLENIVVTREGSNEACVKLIDFGLARLERTLGGEPGAKRSYQAPESHKVGLCDAFLGDSFACGVILFAMAAHDYPWLSTKPGVCSCFSKVNVFGLRNCLDHHRLQVDNREMLVKDVLPPGLVDLMVGLLALRPSQRLTFEEQCWKETFSRPSVWDMPWLIADT